MSSITRFRNAPNRFTPDSKEYKYKNDRFDNSYDPKGKNCFWGIHQKANINSREKYNYNETESDLEFIASDNESLEYNLSSSEEEFTDSELEIETDSELEIETDSECESESYSENESNTEEQIESHLKRLPSNSDKNISFKRTKY